MIDLNSILQDFLYERKPTIIERIRNRGELEAQERREASDARKLKDMAKTEGWAEIVVPQIEESIREGFGKLLRPEALTMSEAELKSVIATMQSKLAFIATLKYKVEKGESALKKLEAKK